MKSLAELEAIRQKALEQVSLRTEGSVRVVVGMATCGIAAGAKPVMMSFLEELKKRNISNVSVTQTGCIGVCRLEPMVDVISADGQKVTYVKMTPEKAVQIVAEHIVNGRPCAQYTIGAEENK